MKEKIALITQVFMAVVLTVIIVWDVIAAVWGEGCSTISCIGGRTWSFDWATIPLAWGILTGHLFWTTRGKIVWMWFRIAALVTVACLSVTLDVLDFYDVLPILPAVLGIPLGRLLWPQSWPTGHPLLVWKR